MRLTYLALILILSCATAPKEPPKNQRLFPYGLYKQEVSMMKEGKKIEFPAVTKWSRGLISMVVMGPMDVTLLKYDEDFINYKKTVYVDRNYVPLTDEKALFYFSYMKFLYSLDRSICEGKLCKYDFMGQQYLFDLGDADQVKQIRMKRGDKEMKVEIIRYEAEN